MDHGNWRIVSRIFLGRRRKVEIVFRMLTQEIRPTLSFRRQSKLEPSRKEWAGEAYTCILKEEDHWFFPAHFFFFSIAQATGRVLLFWGGCRGRGLTRFFCVLWFLLFWRLHCSWYKGLIRRMCVCVWFDYRSTQREPSDGKIIECRGNQSRWWRLLRLSRRCPSACQPHRMEKRCIRHLKATWVVIIGAGGNGEGRRRRSSTILMV